MVISCDTITADYLLVYCWGVSLTYCYIVNNSKTQWLQAGLKNFQEGSR